MDTTDDFTELLETTPPTQRREPIVIPQQLVDAACKFIRVKSREKIPLETGWQKPGGANSPHDDELFQYWINHRGGNYGVLLSDTLLVVDADDPEISDIARTLPPTFAVETGGGGEHFYYRTSVAYTIPLERDKRNVGHLRAGGAMVVGPGSTHPNGKTYRVLHDVPIAEIDFQQVSDAFSDYIKHDEKPVIPSTIRKNKPGQGDDWISRLTLSDVGCYPNDVKRTTANGEIQGSHPIHGSTTGMNFCINERENVWYCHRCGSGGGPLLWLAVAEGIISCDDARPGVLRGETFVKVIERAEELGLKPPGEAPGEPAPTSYIEPRFDISGLEHNLIRRMYDHQCDKIDGYPEYQLIAALATVAAMVDRNALIETLHGTTYTNLYCLLIGKTTISGKTLTIDEITHYINEIDPNLTVSNAPGSHVGFFEGLSDPTRLPEDRKGHGILLVDEAITFFKILQTPIFTEFRGWLFKLWDCARIHRSLAGNKKTGKKIEFTVEKPYFNAVLGIQPDVLAETTTKLDLYSGLFPRFLVSYHTYNRRLKPTRQWSKNQKSAYMEIKKRLHYIHNFFNAHRINFLFSIAASAKLDDWVIEAINKAQNKRDDVLLALYGRARQQVYKIAMLLQISQDGFLDELLRVNDKQRIFEDEFIDDEYVELAIRLYEEYFIPCSLNAMQLIGLDQTKPVEMIRRALMRAEGHTLDGRRLTHATGLGKRFFRDAIDQMVEYGLISEAKRRNPRGRDTTFYTLLPEM